MPITASYSSGTRKLSVLGDANDNSIVISRQNNTATSQLFVNGGAVPVSGGPALFNNTDLIELFGFDLNDVLTLDETVGVLPASTMTGGNGNDTLTGGSNGDTLNGDAGADILLGRGGIDTLNGGIDGDTLTGGAGNDVMNGEGGNDRMIWNPGDGSDVMEGGTDSDIAEINGDGTDETFSIAQNGTRVDLDRTTPAPFSIDIGTSESLLLNMGGGNDIVGTVGNFIGLITLTIDGGAGNDTINGSNNSDLLLGGDGNDVVDGNSGADTAFLGANDDQFKWDPGDGSDTVEGQSGVDELLFNGSNASENISITPNAGRISFFRDVAAITMDLNDVEEITYRALGGADTITIGDITGTDLTSVFVDLAAAGGGGDTQVDRVIVNGTINGDSITASSAGASVSVAMTQVSPAGGPSWTVRVDNPEAADRLILNGGSSNDQISATGVVAGQMVVEMLGGLGSDTMIGSDGGDFFTGGDGNDTALMGAGNDTFTWNPGDDLDVLEGQAGTDTMVFNGNSAVENFTVSPNGGRIIFFRDVAAVTMDLNDVEQINLSAGGGADVVTINDVTGTDITQVTVNLALVIGGTTGDSTTDTVTANLSAAASNVTIAGSGGAVTATGLPYGLALNQSEAIDQLIINAAAGADVISASGLAAGNVALTLRGDAGADTLTGSAGADVLQGGSENDIITGGPGADNLQGELGNDLIVWNPGDGSDLFEGGDGTDNAQVNGGNGAEAFVITANGARVAFDRVDPAPFTLDIGTTETLILFANGGDDTISTSGNLAALIALNLDGGAGNDTILAGNGNDVVLGGTGDDFVDGNQGADTALLGAGNDVFQWDPGDGSDLVEGEDGSDSLIFNGNGANEIFTVAPNGGRARVTRDVGLITMDINDLEQVIVNAGAGTDTINVSDMSGTDVNTVAVNLSGTIGGSAPDGVFDSVTLAGTGLDNLITVLGAGSAYSVSGLPVFLSVTQNDPSDGLTIQAGGGNDFISASSLGAGVVAALLDGGTGDDTILGGGGGDTILGGDGNDLIDGNPGGDVAFLGIGNDAFVWDPGDGSDVIEGQAGTDTLIFNGSNANEVISISPNGGRSILTRDVASIIMDMDDMETLTVNTFGGSDIIVVSNLAGTDVTRVIVNLAAASGGGDNLADQVQVSASAIGDILNIDVLASGAIEVTGTSATVEIRNFDAKDRLVINAGDGNDTIDATGVPLAITVFAGIGDDSVRGGLASDVLFTGAGANTVFLSPGNDFLDSSGGTATVFI